MSNKHENLTSLFLDIADAIREKTGGTATITADEFPDVIRAIDTSEDLTAEIAEQEEKLTAQDALIANMMTALEGKAAGGGASFDTCTLSCTSDLFNNPFIKVTVINNGVVETTENIISKFAGVSIANVLCGSCAIVEPAGFNSLLDTAISIDGEEYMPDSDYHYAFTVPNKKDGIVEVSIYQSMSQ